LPLSEFFEGVRSIVEQVRVSHPMLLVLIAFRQEPQFIATVVEPLGRGRRLILSTELGIYEKIVVSGKGHLHEPAAILRHDDEAEPLVGDLLGGPP
jgi:hypothetical protein